MRRSILAGLIAASIGSTLLWADGINIPAPSWTYAITSLGTGVATALGINVGTAGAPVINGGALGTPSSGTLTSATGLPLTSGVTGTLPLANGGTGITATPNFKVTLASSQSLTTGTWTKVAFDTVVIDPQTYWSTSNKYYNPQVSGTYMFCAGVTAGGTFTLGADNFLISFSKNGLTGGAGVRQGTISVNVPTLVGADPSVAGCTVVALNGSSDTLELDVLVTATSPAAQGSANVITYLVGYRVAP
jgi:hypothetical protein